MNGQPLTIVCPHCQQTVSLDEALTHELTDKFRKDFDTRLENEKEKWHKEALAKVESMVKERFELDIRTTKEELAEAKKRNQELLLQLTEMNRLIRELKRKDEERTLEMEKQKLEWEERIRSETKKKTEEEIHLKLLEKDKQLQNALKEAEELRRKLQQGSQQNQGEVLELELEQILSREFPHDKITPIGKGVRGADLIQEVWDRTGVRCGVILWETKNAKWNANWIDKLKDDQRELKAELAVLISEIVPPDIKGAAYRDSVWVAERQFAIGIGMALRANLIQSSYIKRTMQGKNEKKEILWNYLTGVEFHQRMQAIFEAFSSMKMELEKEKQAYGKIWARREKQIQKVLDNTVGLQGDLEGLIGANALPEMKQLELSGNSEQFEADSV